MRLFFAVFLLIFTRSLHAQFTIAEPVINTGIYTITDTVYMAVNGDDTNPGTFALPVKSFDVALQKLPFGTAGVNGGNAYGLILLKPGYYKTATGFQQNINRWANGNGGFRNVSVEGMGEVTIGGTADTFAGNHLLYLSGNHIFIKNIKLKYGNIMGVLIGRTDLSYPRQNNVLIENVQVDSVGSFSMLLRNTDTILVRNSSSFHASRPGSHNFTSPCQWPSGIKFVNSSDCTIHDSEIAYTRGEGLNFHNSIRGEAYRNKLHDNGLNFYNDNSAKLRVHHNLIYNTPVLGNQYWRNCPADTGAVLANSGMLIANEGACSQGNAPVFENCQTKCILPTEFFANVDSMFVYNNIFQDVGNAIGFWQGVTDINGANCIRNVFITNNTVIGMRGMPGTVNWPLIQFFFPSYNLVFNSFYSYLQNVKITNNIFAYDTVAYPLITPVRKVFHALHPGPQDIVFNGNIWVQPHAYFGNDDIVRNDLPGSTYFLGDSLFSILPCPDNAAWVYAQPASLPFLTDDYKGMPRNANATNVGALEFDATCSAPISSVYDFMPNAEVSIYPNPCLDCKTLNLRNLPQHQELLYTLYTIEGKVITEGKLQNSTIELNVPFQGMAILLVSGNNYQIHNRVLVKRN